MKSKMYLLLIVAFLSSCGYARFIRIPTSYPVRSASPHIASSEYMAGVARRDITPYDKTYLAGFNFNRDAYGIHDRLETRALALSDGTGKLYIFITVDLIGFFNPDVQHLKDHIRIPGSEVFVLSSHNHQGPDTMGLWGPGIRKKHFKLPLASGRDENYIDWLIDQMAQAAVSAASNLKPIATMALGTISIDDMCRNRREKQFFDSELSVLSFYNQENTNLGVLANFGCHPETVDNDNRLVTSDFVGMYRRIIDENLDTTSFFVNGALGAMVSPGFEWQNGSFEGRETFGKKFAWYVLDALGDSHRVDTSKSIYFSKEVIQIPLENKLFWWAGVLGAMPLRGTLSSGVITTEVSVLKIGEVTIIMIPGEIAPELGLELKKMAGPNTQVWTLANDEIGYILHPDKCDWPMYRYERGKSVGCQAWPIIHESVQRQISKLR